MHLEITFYFTTCAFIQISETHNELLQIELSDVLTFLEFNLHLCYYHTTTARVIFGIPHIPPSFLHTSGGRGRYVE